MSYQIVTSFIDEFTGEVISRYWGNCKNKEDIEKLSEVIQKNIDYELIEIIKK